MAELADDRVDAYFERIEEVELPADAEGPGQRVRREEGLAVRLRRARRSWIASRDELTSEAFSEAVRQVARTPPQAVYTPPAFDLRQLSEIAPGELLTFQKRVDERVRELDAAFEFKLRLRRHRRESFVVGGQFAADPQSELYFSAEAELPWGRYGSLLVGLGEEAVDEVASALVGLFRARSKAPPNDRSCALTFGPAAAAVLLHEAVAHLLEADTLSLTGRAEAAIGVQVASPLLSVLDDPQSAPTSVRRTYDDEGSPVIRRWLLKEGVIDQPLADEGYGGESSVFVPGAGRRSHRHEVPGPRSTHLELLPGEEELEDLLDDGLYFPRVERGSLDPWTGRLEVVFPWGRRVRAGRQGEFVGRCRLRATAADLLGAVVAVGGETEVGGAGWCAKDGQRLPVWASAPSLRVEGLGVSG